MKRSGFARPQYEPAPATPPRRLERTPNYTTVAYRGGGREKEPRIEIPRLMLMARRPGQMCLLQIPRVCEGARDDTCHCHLNGAAYNKGLGMKAHDPFGVRGCARCHTFLDSSYSATYEERQAAGLVGLARQIDEWKQQEHTLPDLKDREAVQTALRFLRLKGFAS